MMYAIRFLRLLFLLLLSGIPPAAARWQPFARHITIHDGLPSNVIYDVLEDSKGFMWFCTDQGISRYDGANFHNYTAKDGLPDMSVFRIREDQQHRFWLICYNKKACYLKDGQVYTSENDALCRRIDAEGIDYDEMFTDRDGNDCLVGKKVAVLGRQPDYLYVLPALTLPAGRAQHFRANGEDYIVVGRGVYSIHTDFHYRIHITKGYIGISFFDGESLFISGVGPPDRAQELEQWRFEDGRFSLVKKHYLPARVFQIGPLKAGGMSISTAGGILFYDRATGRIAPDTAFPAGVQTNCIRTDRDGNCWLTTLNNGVYFMPAGAGRIIDRRSGLAGDNMLSVSLDKAGDLLAGDDAGHVYRIKQDKIRTYALDAPQNANRVLFVQESAMGVLFAGSDVGLYLIHHNGMPRLISANSIKAGAASGRQFYAGTASGLVHYDTCTGKAGDALGGRITAVAVDNQGTLWTGNIRGLHYFKDGKPVKYNADSVLRDCFISWIIPAAGGGIIAASSTHGLFFLKDAQQPALRLDQRKGLGSNNCKRVFVAANGFIWLCTDAGVDRIQQTSDRSFSIRPYPLPQGMAGNQVNDLVETNGRLYLATTQGILVLNSGDMLQSRPPRLYIEALNGRPPSAQPLRIPFNDRNLQVSYAGLSYTGGTPLQYKYILSGGTTDTLYTQAQTIDFTALSPGAYELQLWCRSPGSQWTAQPVRLSFTILPPLWRHPLVLLCALLLAGALLALIFRFRIRKIKKRAAVEARNQQQLAELEMNALRAQINPHFIFNALNAIQFYYSQNDELTANHYMTSFAHFIRLTLTYSQAHWLPLSEEIAMLRTYSELEQIRYQQLFSVTFDIAPGLSAEQVAIPAMLIQPYVENAINHGLRYLKKRKGKLVLSFSIRDNSLYCIVDDNGIGRVQSAIYKQAQHTSMGTKITHQRIATINRMYGISVAVSIIDKPEEGDGPAGTRVSLCIPLKLTDHDFNHADR